jgi:hypothetical protein
MDNNIYVAGFEVRSKIKSRNCSLQEKIKCALMIFKGNFRKNKQTNK